MLFLKGGTLFCCSSMKNKNPSKISSCSVTTYLLEGSTEFDHHPLPLLMAQRSSVDGVPLSIPIPIIAGSH